MSAQLTITIPVWLDFLFACPLLAYRLLRYGYTFRRIYLGEGEWTIVDPADYYRFGNFKWGIDGQKTRFYAVRNVKNGDKKVKKVRLHREIMQAPVGVLVDHRNRETLDNRRANLRFATQSQNMQNRRKRKNTTSRYIGVCLDKQRGQWEVRIIHRGKRIWIGRFHTEIEAARVHDEAAKKYHGEFARLNFPEPQITQIPRII
jgi:hypothetical protein